MQSPSEHLYVLADRVLDLADITKDLEFRVGDKLQAVKDEIEIRLVTLQELLRQRVEKTLP